MLNRALLKPEIAKFVYENRKNDLPSLILKGSPFTEVTVQELAQQIQGVKIAEKKFPEFYQNRQIIYPPKLNLEQTSSEITAQYKASLVSGKKGIDLTGGLGIDSYYLSKNFEDFTYCELDTHLSEIAAHNFEVLNAGNIRTLNQNSLEFLAVKNEIFDVIYADPARRDEHGGKVFKLEDCIPDIPSNLLLLFAHTNTILLKTSPMLDFRIGMQELQRVKEIHVVAVNNEVREVLWILDKNFTEVNPLLKAINFGRNRKEELAGKLEETGEKAEISRPLNFLYEPNAAIMKSGLFDLVAGKTKTKKLHQNSHLFTSEENLEFPGRKFQITEIEHYKASDLKKKLKGKKANITIRNFPESVEDIRKKFKIKEGGEDYIFFTTNLNEEKIVIFCKKI
ncbi:SAM-dependent methyltransferase [Christiangramia fulva]|uniref:SAM-dependent methyltransferase n=1 Tax=Christiangramia fulva TaxID=2126553 RepID=A0A2R3Z837_9FLAO|nr:class I SAM-dependent methyltransferase [Christiangramia fulva]AVR46409.1 SAM-dependent methyltransferase [Christiangramia fulva]